MIRKTISAQVVHGHLQHEEDLSELEGQQVLASLTVVPKNSTTGQNHPESPSQNQGEEIDYDPAPPPWLEVEKDLYFPISSPEILLEKAEVQVEQGQPCIILPEELPDE